MNQQHGIEDCLLKVLDSYQCMKKIAQRIRVQSHIGEHVEVCASCNNLRFCPGHSYQSCNTAVCEGCGARMCWYDSDDTEVNYCIFIVEVGSARIVRAVCRRCWCIYNGNCN